MSKGVKFIFSYIIVPIMVQNIKNILEVVVHPNSKSPRIETSSDNALHIFVREPAVEGKANKAVVEVLSKKYKTPKSSITLIRGSKSKNKFFEIVM